MDFSKCRLHLSRYGIVYILVGFGILSLVGIFYNFSVINTVGDETVLMAATLKMIAEHTLRPAYETNYHMPIGTYIYLPFFMIALLAMRFSGLFSSFGEIKEFGLLDYAKLLPIARFVSVILGIASIYLVYRICQKLFNNTFISLTASFLLATNITFLDLAHFGKVWMPQIFMILLAFYYIVDLYKKDTDKISNKDYLRQSFLIAASFGTHFVGVLVYIPFLVVHYLKNRGKTFIKIFIKNSNFWMANVALILLILLVFYLNPYGFLNYAGWSSKATSNIVVQSTDSPSYSFDIWRGVGIYMVFLLEYGHVLTVIFLLSLIPLFWWKRNLFFIIFSFILGYYFVIGPLLASGGRPVPIYMGPIVPFMAIVASYGIFEFYKSGFLSQKIKIVAIFLILFSFFYLPIAFDYAILRPSSAVEATGWIRNNIPSGSKILNIGLALPLDENRDAIKDIQKYKPDFLTKRRAYMLSMEEENYPRPNYYILDTGIYNNDVPPEVAKIGFDYVVISWDSGGYDSAFAKAESYGASKENLIKMFPASADSNSLSGNIEGIRNPILNLLKLTHSGPVIAVYKISK